MSSPLSTTYNGFELLCASEPVDGGYVPLLVVRGDMGIAMAERRIYLEAEPFETLEDATRHAMEEGKAWVDLRA